MYTCTYIYILKQIPLPSANDVEGDGVILPVALQMFALALLGNVNKLPDDCDWLETAVDMNDSNDDDMLVVIDALLVFKDTLLLIVTVNPLLSDIADTPI